MSKPLQEHLPDSSRGNTSIDRRKFLRSAVLGVGAISFLSCDAEKTRRLFRKRLRRLSREEIAQLLAETKQSCEDRFKKETTVTALGPLKGVEFGYALDLSRCIGCRRCVYACVRENNQSRDPQVHWIRVLQMEQEHGIDVTESTLYYNPDLVPEEGHFYMPVQCQQCRKPPCIKVCPVAATWQEEDGVTVVDYDWCIGCRYCMAACPYGARHFNWGEPTLSPEEFNPDLHILGNRPRPAGVVEKCHLCLQRSRTGRYPACVEICPVGARKFGNLLDPNDEVRYIIENKRVYVFKEELNTQPRFYYFYGT